VPKSGEHWLGEDVPQPAQNVEDGVTGPLAVHEPLPGIHYVLQGLLHYRHLIHDCINAHPGQAYYTWLSVVGPYDQGVATVMARVNDHHGSISGRCGQLRMRDSGEELLEPF
jgi:hypothetical protein